mmetsp:Transcript_29632/g.65602  ORF Transcript_29632/g.65602 Transcript_29632/m.65602 type:complete len:119 (+) Transcript_29632:52-408(+)
MMLLLPPCMACRYGQAEMAHLLLKRTGNDAVPGAGTALHTPCRQGLVSMVRVPPDRILDPNAADAAGTTAVHVACFNGQVDAALLLLESNRVNIHAEAGNLGTAPLSWPMAQCGAYAA